MKICGFSNFFLFVFQDYFRDRFFLCTNHIYSPRSSGDFHLSHKILQKWGEKKQIPVKSRHQLKKRKYPVFSINVLYSVIFFRVRLLPLDSGQNGVEEIIDNSFLQMRPKLYFCNQLCPVDSKRQVVAHYRVSSIGWQIAISTSLSSFIQWTTDVC